MQPYFRYELVHKKSKSKTELSVLVSDGKPKVRNVILKEGNIICLKAVKKALLLATERASKENE